MLKVLKFKREDLEQIQVVSALSGLRSQLTSAHMDYFEKSEHSFTGFAGDCPVVCGGVVDYWEGRGEAWAMIDHDSKHSFLEVHHVVKSFLKQCPVNRIEAYVGCDFEPGHRWIKALGFKMEGERLEAYHPGGHDVSLYARIKSWPQR